MMFFSPHCELFPLMRILREVSSVGLISNLDYCFPVTSTPEIHCLRSWEFAVKIDLLCLVHSRTYLLTYGIITRARFKIPTNLKLIAFPWFPFSSLNLFHIGTNCWCNEINEIRLVTVYAWCKVTLYCQLTSSHYPPLVPLPIFIFYKRHMSRFHDFTIRIFKQTSMKHDRGILNININRNELTPPQRHVKFNQAAR